MLFLKILYWALFLAALIVFFYFRDTPLGFFLLLVDMVFMALPKD